jgi:hypothetical protein
MVIFKLHNAAIRPHFSQVLFCHQQGDAAMSKIEKLVKAALIKNFFEGYKCDDPRSAQAIIAALLEAGALKIPTEAVN